jgi:hypothetical protein
MTSCVRGSFPSKWAWWRHRCRNKRSAEWRHSPSKCDVIDGTTRCRPWRNSKWRHLPSKWVMTSSMSQQYVGHDGRATPKWAYLARNGLGGNGGQSLTAYNDVNYMLTQIMQVHTHKLATSGSVHTLCTYGPFYRCRPSSPRCHPHVESPGGAPHAHVRPARVPSGDWLPHHCLRGQSHRLTLKVFQHFAARQRRPVAPHRLTFSTAALWDCR